MSIRTAKALATILAIAGLFAFASAAPAATYLVRPNGSGDYATIQDAIDAVVDTDIIELADGTFDGAGNRDIDFLGKAITVRSQSGDPTVCSIDCGGDEFDPHRGFWFHTGEGASSVVQDISVVNGYIVDGNGGGVLCELSSPTFDGCIFGANIVDGAGVKGGAMYCGGISTPTVTGCRFLGNEAGRFTSGTGGAIALEDGADATITDTVLDGNYCSDMGGGVFAGFCDLTMIDCTIVDNGAQAGAGVRALGGTLTLTGCSILWNMATTGVSEGGGVAISLETLEMSDCTLMGNMAPGGGGGLLVGGSSTAIISNTIVAYSLAGGGIEVSESNRAVSVTCCNVAENTGGNYVGDISDQTGSNDNISEDPQFCDAPSGDLTLYNTSPCAADNSPCGQLIGAEDVDCFTAVEPSSWGKIKASYE